jgi:hypothetical protein
LTRVFHFGIATGTSFVDRTRRSLATVSANTGKPAQESQSGEGSPHWYVASEFNFSLERSHLD